MLADLLTAVFLVLEFNVIHFEDKNVTFSTTTTYIKSNNLN